ncbi:hypothetical protein [Flavobacterium agrisoli]|uniref:Secreted protein n=1 Tax=Flavobacterium agrisoli TaxID=2793066 RepID=A0A934PP92_9FLAO|nr:hypothetical protein [Flavobacterium agrisoli]MBK0370078.1 hypothetical protein [Flavobacterium agrisoli]
MKKKVLAALIAICGIVMVSCSTDEIEQGDGSSIQGMTVEQQNAPLDIKVSEGDGPGDDIIIVPPPPTKN